ncbi:DUF6804 family protein [Rubrivirga sp. IMCC43871]|uniref:DUF6804 family protein n=1 Tax=Rubrivirga sp. IMCC43871 TaxID=3391575 RepID=UPI00398F9E12
MAYKPLALLAAGFLVIALAPMPYGYYTLLRLVVCGVSAYGAFRAAESGATAWTLTLGVTALLFNPIVPIPLDRETWALIDVAAAVLMVVSGFKLREPEGAGPPGR